MARSGASFTTQKAKMGGKTFRDTANGGLARIFFEEMQEAGKAGDAEAKAYVRLAGTQKQWSSGGRGFPDLRQGGGRRRQPNRGRINTGQMMDALTYKVTQGSVIQVKVGWLNNFQPYFLYQDQGFASGGYRERVQDPVSAVEGMKLMAHMRTYMRDQYDKAVDRAIERMMNAL